jgi:L-ribulose-5-phosphate 4-epimerase
MTLKRLKEEVLEANLLLQTHALAKLTWGNVSGILREKGIVVIKPSGVPYEKLTAAKMVVVDLKSGKTVAGDLKPSSDTPTHLILYKAFQDIGGVTHTHSPFATQFAQAERELPCLGTTHADHFMGTVPLVRSLTAKEIAEDYEGHTGHVIVERFQGTKPLEMPAALVAHHGPFTWGKSAMDALKNAVALEACAEMALGTFLLNPKAKSIPSFILDKHYQRKHGPKAYYGQKENH